MPMSLSDQLIHSTVRIETTGADGDGSGTGFFMKLCETENSNVPVIVTNKHVIDAATEGVLHFTQEKDESNEPDYDNHIEMGVSNFEASWIKHPDATVDLAVYPVAHIFRELIQQGHRIFYRTFNTDTLADAAFMDQLNAVEDILMVGYPNGLWDPRHNLPIVRRGITATPTYIDFEDRPEFMIDCACFPGSSGSPIVLYNVGTYVDKEGNTQLGGERFKLLAVLWGGPQHTAEGDIRAVPVPTALQSIVLSGIPNNLGYCVKAEQLRAFESLLQEGVDAEPATMEGSEANVPV